MSFLRPYVKPPEQCGIAFMEVLLVINPAEMNSVAAVRNLFLTSEGGTTKVPTGLSYEEWDCTALFQATIYSRSLDLRNGRGYKTLSDLYM